MYPKLVIKQTLQYTKAYENIVFLCTVRNTFFGTQV